MTPLERPEPDVHYLTRHLRVPCRPDLADLTGAPLNSVFRDQVTCEACKASPEYAAIADVGRQP